MAEIIFRMFVTSFRVKKTWAEIFPPTRFRRDNNYTSRQNFFRPIRFDNPNIFLKSEGRTLFISVFSFVLDWVLKEKSTGGNFPVRPKYQIFIWLRAIKTNPMAEIIFRMLVTSFRVKKTRTEIFPPTQFRRDVNYTSCRNFFRRIRFDNPNIFLKSEGHTLFISVFSFVLDWVLKEKSTGENFSAQHKYQIFILMIR